MTYSIGQMVSLNGKEYKIVGTKARSFLLERDGKMFKATADKLSKIEAQNSRPVQTALERRIAYAQIFDKSIALPKSEAEIMHWFSVLESELSPENLSCDGELSRAGVANKLRDIKACWAELESKLGRKVIGGLVK